MNEIITKLLESFTLCLCHRLTRNRFHSSSSYYYRESWRLFSIQTLRVSSCQQWPAWTTTLCDLLRLFWLNSERETSKLTHAIQTFIEPIRHAIVDDSWQSCFSYSIWLSWLWSRFVINVVVVNHDKRVTSGRELRVKQERPFLFALRCQAYRFTR